MIQSWLKWKETIGFDDSWKEDFRGNNLVNTGWWASLVAQLVKNHLQWRRPQFDSWVGKFPWRRDKLPTSVFTASLVDQMVKNPSECRRPGYNLWVGKIPLRTARWLAPASILAWGITVDRGACPLTKQSIHSTYRLVIQNPVLEFSLLNERRKRSENIYIQGLRSYLRNQLERVLFKFRTLPAVFYYHEVQLLSLLVLSKRGQETFRDIWVLTPKFCLITRS